MIGFNLARENKEGIVAYLTYNSMCIVDKKTIFYKFSGIGEIKATNKGLKGTPREEVIGIIKKVKKLVATDKLRNEEKDVVE